mgnify:FL=1
MRYATNDEFWKDTILFRCQCRAYEFLEIVKIDFDDASPQYSVSIMSEPHTLFERLKYLFKSEMYVKEILLSSQDIKILKNMKE